MIIYREDNCPTLRGTKLRIADAQPREEMAGELYGQIRAGSPWASLKDDVLTIWDDYGHRYIYRVTAYDAARDVYSMEWPD